MDMLGAADGASIEIAGSGGKFSEDRRLGGARPRHSRQPDPDQAADADSDAADAPRRSPRRPMHTGSYRGGAVRGTSLADSVHGREGRDPAARVLTWPRGPARPLVGLIVRPGPACIRSSGAVTACGSARSRNPEPAAAAARHAGRRLRRPSRAARAGASSRRGGGGG